jgi:hypothetical protein
VPTGVWPGGDDLHPRQLAEHYLRAIPTATEIGDSPAELADFVACLPQQ